MQKITTGAELKSAIQELEYKQASEWTLLHEQFHTAYESLKPVNLIKSTFSELTSTPDFKENILDTTLGLAAGYLSKKMVVGATHNPLKQILGTVLQFAITNIVSKNTDGIKSTGDALLKRIFKKKNESEGKSSTDISDSF